jgi:hypothetical protein
MPGTIKESRTYRRIVLEGKCPYIHKGLKLVVGQHHECYNVDGIHAIHYFVEHNGMD